jgi:hypothetical protein
VSGELGCLVDCFYEAMFVSFARSGDVKGSAVIDGGTDNGEAKGDVDA